jgi:hypothetical protein
MKEHFPLLDVMTRATDNAKKLAAAFRPIGLIALQSDARFRPLAALLEEAQRAQRGPTIGRKRRARRARGRARQMKTTTRFR